MRVCHQSADWGRWASPAHRNALAGADCHARASLFDSRARRHGDASGTD
jgi:hypothetical protein